MTFSNELPDFIPELTFTAVRSSRPGGQNVNKLNIKVTLSFHVKKSVLLSKDEKALVLKNLANKINIYGVLKISSQSERSQFANKKKCIEKFYEQIDKALIVPKKRKKKRPSKALIQKRLDAKRHNSEKKQSRKLNKLLVR